MSGTANQVVYKNASNVASGSSNFTFTDSTNVMSVSNATVTTLLTFTDFTEGVVAIGNSGTSKTISIASGTTQTCTLTGNCTFTMPTATAGKSFTLFLNTGAGGYTATFTSVKWADNLAPVITTTASKVDVLMFVADGTYWYGSYSQNY